MYDNKEIKELRINNLKGIQVSRNIYNLIIGLTLLFGILTNIVMAKTFSTQILSMPYWLILIIYFAVSIGSIFLIYNSKNPVLSFLGFTTLSIGFGFLITYFVSFYTKLEIYNAFLITGLVVTVMTIISTIFPQFFLKLGKILFISLLSVIIIEIIMLLLRISSTIIDLIVCVIFCGYIGYDWQVAQKYPPTIDNAIDSAADIYVDIVNLFVRILSILGKKK